MYGDLLFNIKELLVLQGSESALWQHRLCLTMLLGPGLYWQLDAVVP